MPPQLASAVIAGVNAGWPHDKSPALDGIEDQFRLRSSGSTSLPRRTLVQLAMRQGQLKIRNDRGEIAETLLARAEDGSLAIDERLAARAI